MDPKLKSFIIATLRRASYRWKSRTEALRDARVRRGVYICAECKTEQPKKNIQLDHKYPIVPITGWDNWEGFMMRLFCDKDSYQVLCREHHSIKTKFENEQRRLNKKKEL